MSRDYQDHISATLALQAERTAASQDIGDIPKVKNRRRRNRCAKSLVKFCKAYAGRTFYLPWADFHYRAAEKIERSAIEGGLYAFCMPRGSGKTSLCEWAAIWAVLYGHAQYVVVIGATETRAQQRLANIKTAIQVNDRLLEDFPEAIYPIRKLERSVRRCEGQKYKGDPTAIKWSQKWIAMPTIPDSPSSGSIIEVAGITGEIRGMMRTKWGGGIPVRPDFAVVDDPQTREAAKSETQSMDREAVISGDVAYLAGPDKSIAVVVPCTVIYRQDLADRMLDRQMHPEWRGERTKMVLSFPTDAKLWDQYAEIRTNCLREDGDLKPATSFYRRHRKAMDAGGIVSWPERYIKGRELSAIQHVMNLRFQDEVAFASEYQGEPISQHAGDFEELLPAQLAAKQNGMVRGIVPLACQVLTCHIDVQKKLLYYTVVAWEDDFTGYVIDYGSWPDQGRRDFTLARATFTLQSAYPASGLEGQIFQGLTDLWKHVLGAAWRRDSDDTQLYLDRALIDANWAESSQIVYRFCRESEWSRVLMPAHGKGIGASQKSWEEYLQRRGERLGNHWRIPAVNRGRSVRHVIYDTNWWKSFVHQRWRDGIGDRGSLTLYGRDRAGKNIGGKHHLPFGYHQTAEYPVRAEAYGRTVDEWRLKSNKPDNHWLDNIVGAAVAASMSGMAHIGSPKIQSAATVGPRITMETLRELGRIPA